METSDDEIELTPPNLGEIAKEVSLNLLPRKSRSLYEKRHEEFMNWCSGQGVKTVTENVMLAYFSLKAKVNKPSSLWSRYSMLKTTLKVKCDVNIKEFHKLTSFLKLKSVGYKPKKSKSLSQNDVTNFLLQAPNKDYLMEKVVLIFGIAGACRRDELVKMTTDDVEDRSSVLVVTIPDSKTNKSRVFTITNIESTVDYIDICKQYLNLRPQNPTTNRLFLKYSKGVCTNQVIGINTIAKIPSKIARFLGLNNPFEYTGHCFRRSSATMLVNGGGDITQLKRHGGWTSKTVAEGYIDDSIETNNLTAQKILGNKNSQNLPDPSPTLKGNLEMGRKGGKLRLMTYMCPSHPVELYELLMAYLEEALDCEATLVYETRSNGPLPDRVDPFTDDSIDLAFMTSAAYVKLLESKNEYAELLPVAAIFKHPLNKDDSPCYYSDIIIHVDGKKHVKEFLDLRGCRWAYASDESLSGSTIVLKNLKELGENASFFGNTIRSGSHLASIQMVLQKQAEAAAVDANTLAYNKLYLQDRGKDIYVLDSLGPLPPYPIVINSRLTDDRKQKLCSSLMKMTDTRLWGERISKFGVIGFGKNYEEKYDIVTDLKESVKNSGLGIRYY